MHIFVLDCKVLCCLGCISKAIIVIGVFHNESKPLCYIPVRKMSGLVSKYLQL